MFWLKGPTKLPFNLKARLITLIFNSMYGSGISYENSSSSSKFIFQQRTFKNHKIQKYK